MHRCLLILELVERICNEFNFGEHRGPLLAMALTCQFFERPALAALWRSIPDLTPIIRCAGGDLWRIYINRNKMTFGLRRRISASDVEIMKKYGRFVRSFGRPTKSLVTQILQGIPRLHIELAVWGNLKFACEGFVLFTNLQVLNIHDLNVAIMGCRSLFYVQNLTNIVMDNYALRHAAEFSLMCPNVKTIRYAELLEDMDERNLTSAMLALSNWRELTKVYLVQGSPEFIQALSHSPQLQFLEFHRYFVPNAFRWTPLSSIHPNTSIFSALRDVAIIFDEFSHAIQTIDYFPPLANLESLFIGISNELACKEEDWRNLFRAIGKHSHVLERLYIDEGDSVELMGENLEAIVPLSNHVINTLSTFTTLTHIKISNMGSYNIVDEDLENLTNALPRLVVFHLTCSANLLSEYPVTIASLLHFARNCPSLHSLGLEFDGRQDKIPKESSYSSIRGPRLRIIDVGESPVDSPEKVAKFLHVVFPNLGDITYYGKCESDPEYESESKSGSESNDPKRPWGRIQELVKTSKEESQG